MLHLPDGRHHFLKIRSMVGLIPLFATETIEPEMLDHCPGFRRRMQWFIDNRPDLSRHVDMSEKNKAGQARILLSLVGREPLRRVLRYMLDEEEFLSPYGIRSVSRCHRENPYRLFVNANEHRVDYEPAESRTSLFGGNSNWRGPIWFPVNYLIIESLQKFHHYFGPSVKAEFPHGSGRALTLWDTAAELSRRLTRLFLRAPDGSRPCFGPVPLFQRDPHWRDLIPFHEFFHGDSGAGLGASHQTGWTGLVAKLIQQSGD